MSDDDTPETISVGSTAPMAIRIEGPAINRDDPAESWKEPETFHINGNRHASAVGGVALTHGVPSGMFHQWIKRHPHLSALLHPMTPEDVEAHYDQHASYGHEPGIAATTEANEKAGLSDPHPEKLADDPGPAAPPPEAA